MECMMPHSRSFMMGAAGRGEELWMPRIVGPSFLPSFGLIRIFKNLGGFEFLGSMSFNQTELQRPPPESSGEWVTSRQVRRRRQGGFNPREEKRRKERD